MKKFVAGLVIGLLIATAGVGLAANETIRLFVNGQEVVPDVPPVIIDGRVMVPARFIAEPLGATVEWDGDNRTVIITSKTDSIATSSVEKQDSLYFPGRTIVDILGKKYPNAKITGLGTSNILWFETRQFELPRIIGNNRYRFSIQPLIEAGLITLSDFQDN